MRKLGSDLTAKWRVGRAVSAAVATVTFAGVLMTVTASNVALESAPAFADTGTVNFSCTAGAQTFAIPIDITGSIPTGLIGGDTFNLTNYQDQVTIPPSVATTLVNEGITQLEGTTGALVNATNATPGSMTPSIPWGPVSFGAGGVTFDVPSSPITVGPFTATSAASPPVLSEGTFTTALLVGGNPYTSICTPPAPAPVIAGSALSLTTIPSATNTVVDTPGGMTDTAAAAGEAALGAPTGTVTFYVCGPAVSTCSSAGHLVGSGPVTLAPGADATSTATSAVIPTPSVPGSYCFFASYSGDGNYPPTDDASSGECFVVAPSITCNPSCTGTVASTAGSVGVSGSSSTSGNLFLSVGQTALNCGNGYSSLAQYTTIQESDFASSAPLTATDTVLNDPTLKRFGVCFQSFAGTFKNVHGAKVRIGLLHKCHGTAFPAPCVESTRESGGNVVAVLLVPPNDPRFHGGGTAPLVTGVSPASGAPKATVTVKGLFLKGATVKVGSVAVRAKSSASKVSFTLPGAVPAGIVPITITTPTGSIVYRTFQIT
ncbi:MAG TPA: hypothetical protein VII76_15195 [Acidimicrobiales bacterium]